MTETVTASVVLFVALWLAVAGVLVAMGVTDVRERRIPNKLVVAVCAIWALMQAISGSLGAAAGVSLAEAARLCGVSGPLLTLFALPDALTGAFTAAAAVACLALTGALYERIFRKQAMGAGDVKLIGAFALFLGPAPTLLCVMLACLFALVAALPARMRAFPFAPALIVAFVCAIFIEL